MNFTLKIWRQKDAKTKGGFETYKVENISADTSFLEMLDILNNNLIHEGKEPVAFDHDCREGICACARCTSTSRPRPVRPLPPARFTCASSRTAQRSPSSRGARGVPRHQGPRREPLGLRPDSSGRGFISVRTNSVPDANAIPIAQADAEESMDAAACIGCGACAQTCKNGSAMLFVAARVSSLAKTARRPCGGCTPRQGDGRQDGRAGLRQLHQHGRLPSRVPQVDFDRAHRAPEPRVPLREVRRLIKVPEQSGEGREYASRPFSCPGTQTLASCIPHFLPRDSSRSFAPAPLPGTISGRSRGASREYPKRRQPMLFFRTVPQQRYRSCDETRKTKTTKAWTS